MSIPGESAMRFEARLASTLPDELRKLGYEVARINYEGRVRDRSLRNHTVRKPRRPRQPAVRRR